MILATLTKDPPITPPWPVGPRPNPFQEVPMSCSVGLSHLSDCCGMPGLELRAKAREERQADSRYGTTG